MPPATAAYRMSPPGLVTADFVIDAGIAIKWYLPEILEAEATKEKPGTTKEKPGT